MTRSKFALFSQTIIGLIVLCASFGAMWKGVPFTDEASKRITDQAAPIVAGIGALLVANGRTRAKRPIHWIPGQQKVSGPIGGTPLVRNGERCGCVAVCLVSAGIVSILGGCSQQNGPAAPLAIQLTPRQVYNLDRAVLVGAEIGLTQAQKSGKIDPATWAKIQADVSLANDQLAAANAFIVANPQIADTPGAFVPQLDPLSIAVPLILAEANSFPIPPALPPATAPAPQPTITAPATPEPSVPIPAG